MEQVEFFVNGVSIGADVSAPYEIEASFPDSGTYLIEAVSTNNAGEETHSKLIYVGKEYFQTSFLLNASNDDAEENLFLNTMNLNLSLIVMY